MPDPCGVRPIITATRFIIRCVIHNVTRPARSVGRLRAGTRSAHWSHHGVSPFSSSGPATTRSTSGSKTGWPSGSFSPSSTGRPSARKSASSPQSHSTGGSVACGIRIVVLATVALLAPKRANSSKRAATDRLDFAETRPGLDWISCRLAPSATEAARLVGQLGDGCEDREPVAIVADRCGCWNASTHDFSLGGGLRPARSRARLRDVRAHRWR